MTRIFLTYATRKHAKKHRNCCEITAISASCHVYLAEYLKRGLHACMHAQNCSCSGGRLALPGSHSWQLCLGHSHLSVLP